MGSSVVLSDTIPDLCHHSADSLQTLKALDRHIDAHNQAYHRDNLTLLEDDAFDALVNNRNKLAHCLKVDSKYPDFKSRSATQNTTRPGYALGTVRKAESDLPIKKFLRQNCHKLFLQPKIDGIAVSLIYENGQLILAHTRGSSGIGNEITEQIKQISDIVKTLPEPVSAVIQGEVFARLNEGDSTGLKNYTSARHFAAAGLNTRQPDRQKLSQLSFFPWKLIINNQQMISHQKLSEWGFKWVAEHTHKINQYQEVLHFRQYYNPDNSEALPFLTDGIVLKTESTDGKLEQLAWKPPPQQTISTVRKINVTHGKTGRLTAIVHIDPVCLRGRTIKKLSVGTRNSLYRKDIAINDIIIIQLSGEAIPALTSVLIRPENRYRPQL